MEVLEEAVHDVPVHHEVFQVEEGLLQVEEEEVQAVFLVRPDQAEDLEDFRLGHPDHHTHQDIFSGVHLHIE